ncbi:SDR family oxidoreductase [Pseudooceanicola algae]|uniref:Putative oxidoreductase n=1 Tax=Pseudooceanicola algae TaxID=1537215 RepID=A0A418SHB0_9RHOB|nr:SDR family oxidoreductase [Pseudooceanicola algae]QPM90439.1 putative oxidoreductase [Pseudooceanicola algae]
MKTVLITGCSSGFGLETARHFLERDWRVIATMRSPRADLLPASDRLTVPPLDVTDPDSIARLVDGVGQVDALVNNAGIGLMGAVEATPPETMRQIFETNTFGTMALTRALLPQFREAGAGTIVNVTSSVTITPLPLLAIYTASKAAVAAYSDCLALEMAQFGVSVRLVLPGRSSTRFAENARPLMQGLVPDSYADFAQRTFGAMAGAVSPTRPEDVVSAIWRAVTDPDCPAHQPAGEDAVAALEGTAT